MFRRRPDTPGPDAAPDAPYEPDHAVCDAEQIVRDAWAAELAEQHGRMEAALQAVSGQCDGAYRRLAAAQRGGDPKKIAAAHAALETALEALRRNEIVCERTHQAFLEEMEVLGRATAVSALARELEGGVLTGGGQPDSPPLPTRPAPASAPAHGGRRVRGLLGRLPALWAANWPSR